MLVMEMRDVSTDFSLESMDLHITESFKDISSHDAFYTTGEALNETGELLFGQVNQTLVLLLSGVTLT